MKPLFVLAFIAISNFCFSQANQVELPYENGKVVFRNHVNKDEKKAVLFEELLKWVENEKSLSEIEVNRKQHTIKAKGKTLVPTRRSKGEFTFEFHAEVIKGGINFWYDKIYYSQIEEYLEVLIEKNKDSDRLPVKENLKFITLGIHTDINAHAKALKQYIKGN